MGLASGRAQLFSKHGVAMLVLGILLTAAACGGSDDDTNDEAAPSPGRSASGTPPEWPAPQDPAERVQAAGLEMETREALQTHRHTHLDVFFNGSPVTVPAGLGIDISDPGVQHAEDPDGNPGYGGIRQCENPCISPLHTHDETGVLHTEASSEDLRTLGQLFLEWDVRLDASCVGDYCSPDTDIAVYVDGDRFSGDPADIPLTDQTEIAIVIGSPPDSIPADAGL